jgi:hypothetical protein
MSGTSSCSALYSNKTSKSRGQQFQGIYLSPQQEALYTILQQNAQLRVNVWRLSWIRAQNPAGDRFTKPAGGELRNRVKQRRQPSWF